MVIALIIRRKTLVTICILDVLPCPISGRQKAVIFLNSKSYTHSME